jgi:hypothetical protein
VLEGRLTWPFVYGNDGGNHANDDGIAVRGSGHVVCHNQIVGFGDATKNEEAGARADDFYGNEVLSASSSTSARATPAPSATASRTPSCRSASSRPTAARSTPSATSS